MAARVHARGGSAARLAALVLAASGKYACGRLHYDALEPTDAAESEALRGDATDALESVVPSFGAPTRVAALSSPADDDDPTCTADMLELFFNSNRTGGAGSGDVWLSRRASITAPWGAPAPVAEVNSPQNETTPEVSADGLTLYLSSNRPGGLGGADIYVSTRSSRTTPFSTPRLVAALNSSSDDISPVQYNAALSMVFVSTRGGGPGGYDVYSAIRSSDAINWGSVALVTELSSGGNDDTPYALEDGLSIYFSPRSLDNIYVAFRRSIDEPFGTPMPLVSVNSSARDLDPWVSPDGHYLLFTSTRSGNSEIWQASR